MPNGTMTGSGTSVDPYIVMDGYDFNALRNITTSTSDIKNIQLGSDISLSMYPIFTPIPSKYFNIDGQNHLVSDINILNGRGIFETLNTQLTKDLRVEGELIHSNVTSPTGFLCGVLNLLTDNSKLSNIQCFAGIAVTLTYADLGCKFGGVAGQVYCSGSNNQMGYIENCIFYGTIQIMVAGTASSANNDTTRAIGGIVGYTDTYSYSAGITITGCISIATFNISGKDSYLYVGGIVGAFRNGSNAVKPTVVQKCVSKTKVYFTNTVATTQPMYIAGITGYSWGSYSTIKQCCSHMDIIYDSIAPISSLYIYGVIANSNTTSIANVITQNYSVLSWENPNDASLPTSSLTAYGISGTTIAAPSSSFYDADVLSIEGGWPMAATDATLGRTTAQLKDQGYLESQGWVF
jgi:hypothetical protein